MPLSPELYSQAQQWIDKDPDQATAEKLQGFLKDEDEAALQQAFGERLAFGTAGLRGLLGVGPGNMNRLLIREATAGLGRFLLDKRPSSKEPSVVIAYDGRHGSKDFATDATGVLTALGIPVRLYQSEAPTPLGAFAVKELGTAAGIVVTASHNPPQYNGYKVYQAGGTQINTPVDGQIAAQIGEVAASSKAPDCLSLEEAKQKGLLSYLTPSMLQTYTDKVLEYFSASTSSASSEQLKQRDALRIAYTPLHGVGAPIAELLFKSAGFSNTWTVPEQRSPDPDFSTVKFPNPEEEGAMDLVHALADDKEAHIAIANDPDADRLSVSARTRDGKIKQLTGDQIGTILGDELMRRAKCDKASNWSLSTIVSSRMLARLAQLDGSKHRETLTGFKWLGGEARRLIVEQGQNFLFAYEEALGYMVSPLVWDKDGLSALLLLSLLAADLHAAGGQTLWTRLEEIHRRTGLSVTFPRTIRLAPGASGSAIMKKLRANLPSTLAGQQIVLVDDLLTHPPYDASKSDGGIPKNDVIRFYIGQKSDEALSKEEIKLTLPRIIIRPSGTEPKVKIYCESRIETLKEGEQYDEKMEKLRRELEILADGFVELCQ
ncbi:putative phosphomannomutase [Microstroma glucosiphilum]|uniref:Putative phosphomannomutase n=1 Tax=Pseudomicrostroma glucosiphilum TaxID=1684307 RepID=A0A316UAR3_9BASI|nr:putative phosphomannomutase [Pseudomicrostroma glucosiphilum]PWN21924.1 putative phosphomannomutase [Pseudomicrostroma glucosiphilum]